MPKILSRTREVKKKYTTEQIKASTVKNARYMVNCQWSDDMNSEKDHLSSVFVSWHEWILDNKGACFFINSPKAEISHSQESRFFHFSQTYCS